MAKKIIGIEVGIANTKILVGQNNKDEFKILDYAIIENSETTYNYNGEVNLEELEPILNQYLKEHKLKNMECYITISCTKAIVRNRSFPKVKLKELTEMVKFEAEQFLPYEISAFYLDFRVIGEIINGNEELLNVMVVAVPKNVIDGFVDLVENIKLRLKKVDIIVNTLYDYYLQYISDGESDILVADIGAKHIRMIAFKGDEYFANTVSENGTDAIINYYFDNFGIGKSDMKEYMFNNGKLEISKFRKIEKDPTFKDFGTLTFGGDVENHLHMKETKEEDFSYILDEISNDIIREILKMSVLFKKRGNLSIDRVFLYGGTIDLLDFKERIQEKTEIETLAISEKNIHVQNYYLENLCEEGKNVIIVDLDRSNMRIIAYKGKEYFVNLKLENGIDKIISKSYDGEQTLDHIYENLFSKKNPEYEEIDIDYSIIIKEINKMLSFFRSRKYDSHIDKIFICGGGSNSKFIRESIESETEIPTHIMNYNFDKSIDEKDYSVLVPMIGSMLGR